MRLDPFGGAVICGVLTGGCFGTLNDWDAPEEDDSNPYQYPNAPSASAPYRSPPERCMPSASAWNAMRRVHDDTEASVHELIKCGGLQTSMSRTFLIVIVASNRDLFDEAAYLELTSFAATYGVDLTVPFEPEGDGRWSTRINASSDSKFTVQFRDPADDSIIIQDPFVIDSYLTGVTAEAAFSIADMKSDLMRRNTITFGWQERGALAHVLGGGEPFANPFSISVSFADLGEWIFGIDLAPGNPDFGPLDSLLDLDVESRVILTDRSGVTDVKYDVAGVRSSLRQIAGSGVQFAVNGIEGQHGGYRLEGGATGLRYNPSGQLLGRFDYRITGPGGALRVTDDYTTSSGLSVAWSCDE